MAAGGSDTRPAIECTEGTSRPAQVRVEVVSSTCEKMPHGDVVLLEGPVIDYARSGPACLTAMNAIYPWIMLSRYDVRTPDLDYDDRSECYRPSCPCGIVTFEIRKIS